jgi:hypothetical protein
MIYRTTDAVNSKGHALSTKSRQHGLHKGFSLPLCDHDLYCYITIRSSFLTYQRILLNRSSATSVTSVTGTAYHPYRPPKFAPGFSCVSILQYFVF